MRASCRPAEAAVSSKSAVYHFFVRAQALTGMRGRPVRPPIITGGGARLIASVRRQHHCIPRRDLILIKNRWAPM